MEPLIYFGLFLLAYFIPTFVAHKSRRASVFVINLFFGWTLLGWVVALFMAIRSLENGKAGV